MSSPLNSGQAKQYRSKKQSSWQLVRSGCGEEIKAKGRGEGGWESMQRDDQSGSVRWAGIAGEALRPGETPMRALSSG